MSAANPHPFHGDAPSIAGATGLARWHLERDELEAAAAACREGLAENPRWTELAQIYLSVLERQRDVDTAAELYARVIVHDPFSVPLRRAYAAVLAAVGDAPRAETLLAETQDILPETVA
ncbi:MAG: hypothetical protein KAI47_10950, partial [Deltaproteobacteria bacterium]|nr:hypothetical protein [Deltaproteobacteria bacterium]